MLLKRNNHIDKSLIAVFRNLKLNYQKQQIALKNKKSPLKTTGIFTYLSLSLKIIFLTSKFFIGFRAML